MFPMTSLLRLARRACALAFVLFAFCGAAAADPAMESASLRPDVAETATPQDTTYRLATGDKIHLIVFGEDDLGGDFDVDGNGFVRLPLIGPVQAAGLSAHELEERIAGALEDGYVKNPRVNVEISNYRPFYIIGAVNKPGQYPYVNNMNALNAVALAGGYTEKSEDGFVYVRRYGETEEVRLAADPTTVIEPGDIVRIRTSLFWRLIDIAGPVSAIVSTRWYLPVPSP